MTLRFPPPTHPAALRAPRLAAAMFALSCCSAGADIVAAPGAPAALSPQITAGGGATRIDIAPPNAAGVSLNQYDRFDVEAAGAVLNNAVGDTRSELLGELEANARLNGRAAQLIVNQVLGDDPSRLRGMLEVAGARADVIVANPHGIDCDGCGFIGATRATLLAGEVQLDGAEGRLRTLSAADSELRIGALGLRDHARAAERIDLIARRIAVAGRVEGLRELRLVAGANRVDAASGDVQGIDEAVAAQVGYAIDIAEAGAMHAGRIDLIATEAGIGVRSAGELSAQTQDLRLDVAGELRLATAHARRDLVIAAGGTLAVDVALDAERDIKLRGPELVNHGTVAAGGALTVDADELRNAGGTLRAGRDLELRSTADIGNRQHGKILAGGDLHAVVDHHLHNSGTIEGGSVRLEVGGTLLNAAASLDSTRGEIDVDALAIDNRGGHMHAAAALRARARGPLQGWLYNARGSIQAGHGDMVLDAGKLGNERGNIKAGGDLRLRVAALAGARGRIAAEGGVQVDCEGELVNDRALLSAQQSLSLHVDGGLDNDYGEIEAGKDLEVVLGEGMTNLGGRVKSMQGKLRLRAPESSVVNDGGDLAAGLALRVDAAELHNDAHARMIGDDIALRVEKLVNDGGRIGAQRALYIDASTIDNRNRGKLVGGEGVELDIQQVLVNDGGRISAHGDALVLRAPHGEIDNRNGELRVPLGQLRCNAGIVQGELRSPRP